MCTWVEGGIEAMKTTYFQYYPKSSLATNYCMYRTLHQHQEHRSSRERVVFLFVHGSLFCVASGKKRLPPWAVAPPLLRPSVYSKQPPIDNVVVCRSSLHEDHFCTPTTATPSVCTMQRDTLEAYIVCRLLLLALYTLLFGWKRALFLSVATHGHKDMYPRYGGKRTATHRR